VKLLPSILRRDARIPERRDSLENPSVDLVSALVAETDGTSITNIALTPLKSLRLTAVYASVRVIAESVASLPLPVYERQGANGRSRVRVPDDPRHWLLNDSPNPEMTAMQLIETWVANALLWGKGYLYVVRNKAGMPVELWPLRPDVTHAKRTPSGQLYYETMLGAGKPVQLPVEQVIVLQSIFGLSPIKVAREALTAAMAAEQYAGHFWSNNARPGGLIEVDGHMTDEEYDEFRRRWRAGHEGLKRSQLIGILSAGMKWQDVGVPPGLAQFIETRQFGVREVARMFRVPPHLIADLEGTVTRASIEQQSIEFVVHTLRPWLVRAEQSLKLALFNTQADRVASRYPQFLADGLMRGDMKTRYEGYALGVQWGWLSRADVRELEDLPFEEGLDEFLVPLNMVGAGALQTVLDGVTTDANGNPLESASSLATLALLLRGKRAQRVLEVLEAKLDEQAPAELPPGESTD
jgi:HK97 family phage portal protein